MNIIKRRLKFRARRRFAGLADNIAGLTSPHHSLLHTAHTKHRAQTLLRNWRKDLRQD